MPTREPEPTAPRALERAVAILRAGGLVAFPTETVYGLGADAKNPAAVRRIFEVKGRPTGHPLIVHLWNASALAQVTEDVPARALKLSELFWPGPLTLVLRRGPEIQRAVTGGQETVAVRVPAHPLALELLERMGTPIAAPSANRFGRVSPTTAAHVRADLGADVDLILDGGAASVGIESTIVDLSGEQPSILRPGGVPRAALEEALGELLPPANQATPRVPGQLASHYAPRARLLLVEAAELGARAHALRAEGLKVGVLLPAPGEAVEADFVLTLGEQTEGYARALYASLRALDDAGADVVLAVAPGATGLGEAVADRLGRAAFVEGQPASGASTPQPQGKGL